MSKHLIALDLDGTVLNHGSIGQDTHLELEIQTDLANAIRTLAKARHEIVIATGRSVDATLPVVEALRIQPKWVVAANGAVVLRRDALAHRAYRREYVESFDPSAILKTIRPQLATASYAVESAEGTFYYTEPIPAGTLPSKQLRVDFDTLLTVPASRVIVVSPDHRIEEFIDAATMAGLKNVSYTVGGTTWLDIAPIGVSKASALERIRVIEGIDRKHIFAAGDGQNDIEMLEWASQYGVGAAMGQAIPIVKKYANTMMSSIEENGLLTGLQNVFPSELRS